MYYIFVVDQVYEMLRYRLIHSDSNSHIVLDKISVNRSRRLHSPFAVDIHLRGIVVSSDMRLLSVPVLIARNFVWGPWEKSHQPFLMPKAICLSGKMRTRNCFCKGLVAPYVFQPSDPF